MQQGWIVLGWITVFITLAFVVGKRTFMILFRTDVYKMELQRIFAKAENDSPRLRFFLSPLGIAFVGVFHVIATVTLVVIAVMLIRFVLTR